MARPHFPRLRPAGEGRSPICESDSLPADASDCINCNEGAWVKAASHASIESKLPNAQRSGLPSRSPMGRARSPGCPAFYPRLADGSARSSSRYGETMAATYAQTQLAPGVVRGNRDVGDYRWRCRADAHVRPYPRDSSRAVDPESEALSTANANVSGPGLPSCR